MSAIFVSAINVDDVVTARRHAISCHESATETGRVVAVGVDAYTGNPTVSLRIDASTSTDYVRSFFASELVHHGPAMPGTWAGRA
jgi:hypothetical protein